MAARQYDEIVDIHRDSIVGRYEYGSEIRDMHFGAGSVCRTVTRTKWTAQTLERRSPAVPISDVADAMSHWCLASPAR